MATAEQLAASTSSVLLPSQPFSEQEIQQQTVIKGPNFDDPAIVNDLGKLLDSYGAIGFQASGLNKGIDIVEKMRTWRPPKDDPDIPPETRTSIFLGCTSNIISSGLREVVRFLVQHRYVDCLVTTAGGIEEDIIKSLRADGMTGKQEETAKDGKETSASASTPNNTDGTKPEKCNTLLGSFTWSGATLRARGLNRIGNLVVPNDNYCRFQEFVEPVLDKMLAEQMVDGGPNIMPDEDEDPSRKGSGKLWTPSEVIWRLGKEVNDEDSICYWAYKNSIPVFCPALTDGSLGDMIYFHSFRNPGLVIDIVRDMRKLNDLTFRAKKAGMIILGGGVTKHHIANAMLVGRNGADFSVYINTAQEFDGSDSGASPDEAVSWGKIRGEAETVKICAEASLVFPLIVANTFAKAHWEEKQKEASGK